MSVLSSLCWCLVSICELLNVCRLVSIVCVSDCRLVFFSSVGIMWIVSVVGDSIVRLKLSDLSVLCFFLIVLILIGVVVIEIGSNSDCMVIV